MTLASREVLGIAVQTLVGTAVAPTILIPPAPGTFRGNEQFEQILDRGRRGEDTMDYRAIQGVGRTEITWDGEVQIGAETNAEPKAQVGYLLDNLLGRSSTSAQIDATGNYDHRLILGTTKAYLTLEHTLLRDSNDRRFSACRVQEMVFRFNAGEGSLTYSATLTGQSPTAVTAQSVTATLGDVWRGWEGRITFNGGTSFARLISAEFTLRRSVQLFYSSQNQQTFADLYLGPLEVLATMVLDFSVVTDLAAFRTKDQSTLAASFTKGTADAASERTFAIGGANFDLGDGPAELDNSNENVRFGVAARGLYTTANGPFTTSSNAATAQNGPIQIQIVQPIVAAY